MGPFSICPGAPYLAEGVHGLAGGAEREGIRIVRPLTERWVDGTERFDRAGENLLVAVAGNTVIGVGAYPSARPSEVRCVRPPATQEATVGAVVRMARTLSTGVRRFYVSPGWRRHGVAHALASQLIESAFTHAELVTCNEPHRTPPAFLGKHGLPARGI